MGQREMLWIVYNVLFAFGYALMLPRFLMRMRRRGGYRRGFLQRLAVYPETLKTKIRERRRIWVHAVSVGEVYVAMRYMHEIRARRPGTAFVLSATTSTGHRVAEARLHPDDVLLYYPADFPGIVRHALRAIDPLCLILTESEIWPNMIRASARRGVPVFIVNGRISRSSYRGYRLLKVFFSRIVRMLDLIIVQTERDRERLIDLGGSAERIVVAGSAKYDVADTAAADAGAVDAVLQRLGWGEPLLLVAGSTWPGEEGILADTYARLKQRFPKLRLILVPRHAERCDEVEAAVRGRGLSVARRSLLNRPGVSADRADVLLVDTTGELMNFYARGDVVFVGKSLTSHGGQNIIEPGVLGKPILVGPNMENFPDVMRDFLDAGALMQVADEAQLESALARLLGDAAERAALGERARRLADRKRGAVRSGVSLILDRLA